MRQKNGIEGYEDGRPISVPRFLAGLLGSSAFLLVATPGPVAWFHNSQFLLEKVVTICYRFQPDALACC